MLEKITFLSVVGYACSDEVSESNGWEVLGELMGVDLDIAVVF